ncbi:MAG: RnfABCDGE type electron transport complex subunit D [Nitrospirales bacterium]
MTLLPVKDKVSGNPRKRDPRLYQIGMLSGLLGYGMLWLNFGVPPIQVAGILLAALGTQYLCTRLSGLPAFDPKSAVISALSLCLLLRTNSLGVALAAAGVAIAGKFLLRWNGKHLFNPTNFSLVLVLASGLGWVSPGQWGQEAYFVFLIGCLGGLVVNRAARSDVTYAFLAAYGGLVLGRALWLGDPLSIPLHQLQNGAFLIFAFFMISDPQTTPDSRTGRLLFAVLVALGAVWVQFGLYRTNGLLWSLVCGALVVPLLDRLFADGRYDWNCPVAVTYPEPIPVPAEPCIQLSLQLSLFPSEPAFTASSIRSTQPTR